MAEKITTVADRIRFGEIMDRAVDYEHRFLVERNRASRAHFERVGPAHLNDVDSEIAATRRELA